jgi:hypothetical protein
MAPRPGFLRPAGHGMLLANRSTLTTFVGHETEVQERMPTCVRSASGPQDHSVLKELGAATATLAGLS